MTDERWGGAIPPWVERPRELGDRRRRRPLRATGQLRVAQAVLGHASITSTQIYVHPSAEASARRSTGWPARCAVDRVRERRGECAGRRARRATGPLRGAGRRAGRRRRAGRARLGSGPPAVRARAERSAVRLRALPGARLSERDRAHRHEPLLALPAPLRPLAARHRRQRPRALLGRGDADAQRGPRAAVPGLPHPGA